MNSDLVVCSQFTLLQMVARCMLLTFSLIGRKPHCRILSTQKQRLFTFWSTKKSFAYLPDREKHFFQCIWSCIILGSCVDTYRHHEQFSVKLFNIFDKCYVCILPARLEFQCVQCKRCHKVAVVFFINTEKERKVRAQEQTKKEKASHLSVSFWMHAQSSR